MSDKGWRHRICGVTPLPQSPVAQGTEQEPSKLLAAGLNPAGGTVPGSHNLPGPTKPLRGGALGKHNKRSKYVGRHRATYVEANAGKKITGVVAVSTVLSLTPQMLGYEVAQMPGLTPGVAVIPPMIMEQAQASPGEVIIVDPPVDVIYAP